MRFLRRVAPWAVAALAAMAFATLVSCRERAANDTPAAPASTPAPPPPPAPTPRPRPLCRVLATSGTTRGAPGASATPAMIAEAGAVLGPGVDVGPPGWVDLGAASRLALRDPRTGREFQLLGIARARPCAPEEDETWLVRGVFESTRGAGEAPGSEQWVVTPYAAVRYATGAVRVEANPYQGLSRIDGGAAFAWAMPGVRIDTRTEARAGAPTAADKPAPKPKPTVTADGWTRFETGLALLFRFDDTRNDAARARVATESCSAIAREARRIARLLAAPDGGIGDLAARHVDARRKARAACAVAALRVEALSPSEAQAALLATVRAAAAEWRALGP